ncbi:phospholipase D-like domain-containing protein [Pontibacter toksunensis]|uniref:Phospholipase D-like domain-containing protein n=1 Tax=Pontibacter toksunensis TaxID=1332631 RepID=A0ABW6BRG6_9BACT
MKILQPHKISTEILDLIYEAKQYLIIVSPYVNFKYWERLASELVNAKNRGVRIDFFVRNEPENAASWEQVEALGITPRLVNNLHAKFYFNEKNGVISSMNLLSSSNSNSIEIGCKLENNEELDELKRFVKDFITTNEIKEKPNDEDLYVSKEKFTVVLQNYIYHNVGSSARAYFSNGVLIISGCSTKFTLSIDKVENKVYIDAVLSQDDAGFYHTEAHNHLRPGYFEYQFVQGGNGYHNMIGGYSKVRLSNTFLDNLRVNEKKELIAAISDFIKGVGDFKTKSRKLYLEKRDKEEAAAKKLKEEAK